MEAQDLQSERLIGDYLRELRVSAWIRQLPKSQSAALEDSVRADISEALAAAGSRDTVTVHRVLDRMGPPGAIVARSTDEPRPGIQGALDTALAPLQRLLGSLRVHGWGLAEIGGLLLMFVVPFYLWWAGPLLGILVVRAAAERWSDAVMHRATVLVVGMLALQALISVALLVLALTTTGSLSEQLGQVLSQVVPDVGGGAPSSPPVSEPGGPTSLSLFQILLAAPAFVAGIGGGLYLLLSPRHRR